MVFRIACFGGRLMHSASGWRWKDGVAEPLMCDIPAQLADLVWSQEERHDAVEIPADLVEAFDPLASAMQAGMFDASAIESKDTPRNAVTSNSALARELLLVPRQVWLRWCTSCPILPVWSSADHALLRKRAMQRGWERPRILFTVGCLTHQ